MGGFFLWLGRGLLAVQIIYFVVAAYLTGFDHLTITNFDGDAARSIALTVKAEWFTDLGWYIYGPFYYRISHFIGVLFPNFLYFEIGTPQYLESTAFTALRLSTFLCLFLLGYGLSCLLVHAKEYRAFTTSMIVAAAMASSTVVQYTFRPYPDMIFSCLLGLSFLLAVHALFHSVNNQGKSRVLAVLSLFIWAAAFQTKITALFYVPALAMLLFQSRFLAWSNIIYPLLAAAFVLLLGHPQNGSIFEYWQEVATGGLIYKAEANELWYSHFMTNYWQQIRMPGTLVFVLGLLSVGIGAQYPFSQTRIRLILGFLLAFTVPLYCFLSNPLSAPVTHYSLSLVTVHLVIIALIGSLLGAFLRGALPFITENHTTFFLSPLVLLMALYFFQVSYIPRHPMEGYATLSSCAKEVREFEAALGEVSGKVFATPYIPFYRRPIPNIELKQKWWHAHIEGLEEDVVGLVASKRFFARFRNPNERLKQYNLTVFKSEELLEKVTEFSEVIYTKDSFVDKEGDTWKRHQVYPACNFELWLQQ